MDMGRSAKTHPLAAVGVGGAAWWGRMAAPTCTERPFPHCRTDGACASTAALSPWPVASFAPCCQFPHLPPHCATPTLTPLQAWAAADLGVAKGKTEYDASALVVLLDEAAEVAGGCRAGPGTGESGP